MRHSNVPIGDEQHDAFVMAQYVGIPGDRMDRFLKVAAMCGYELRKKEDQSPAAERDSSKDQK